jgi:hypothetical protein
MRRRAKFSESVIVTHSWIADSVVAHDDLAGFKADVSPSAALATVKSV